MNRLLLKALCCLALQTSTDLLAQCANNNTPIAGPAITPNCPGTTVVPCVMGGQYALVNVVAGNTYTFSTCGAPFDTQITLYDNAGGGSLGYNDDNWACGIFSLQSSLTWNANFTGQLRVLVDLYNCASNAVCAPLTIVCVAPLTNNTCATAIIIGEGTTGFSSVGATGTDVTNCGFLDNNDVWFQYVATCSGIATATTCGSANFDTVLSAWSTCPGAGGAEVSCNDDAPGCGLTSTITFPVTEGNSYWIRVSGYWNATGTGNLTISCQSLNTGCAPGVAGGQLPGSGSIQIQQNLTPTQLVQDVFLGECLTASNVAFTGTTAAVGTFTNGWRIGIESGIVLTTGNANSAVGPNSLTSTTTANGQPDYPLLTTLAGAPTYDATVLRFDFVPQTNSVTFKYAFASEEYPEWVCATYNDVFGFFVSGPGYAPNTNIATVPGTFYPVAIDHVNNNGGCAPFFPAYYQANPANAPHNEYDGFTVPLTACINTVPCETYTIIIAVADAGDALFDSAVFLEAESFSAGVDLQIDATADQVTVSDEDNCVDYGYFIFSIDQPLGQDVTLTYTITQIGSAVYDPPIPLQVTFPAGQTTVIISVNAIPASLGPDVSSVTIDLDTSQNPLLGCSCTSEFVSTTLYFCDNSILPVTWLGFDARNINEEREVLCAWNTATELNSDHFTVQRSADMVHWIDIGTVPGAGTTAMAQTYEFVDRAPLSGISYYRIRQTDHDGTSGHSEVRSVSRGGPTRFAVYPNPGADLFQLSGHEGGVLKVFDPSGRRVPFTLGQAGELGLHGVAAGVYLLELRRGQAEPERLRLVVR
ncbi:MAG: T9SS type A sorting domain-containing protein [Flavobacteriales bacterium]|nr:T9SS type A sorting domain-containing protein [Flavobacteriales bacterium]